MSGPTVHFSGGRMNNAVLQFASAPKGAIWDRFVIENDADPEDGTGGFREVYELRNYTLDGTTARYVLETGG